jgi:hypothetical protein
MHRTAPPAGVHTCSRTVPELGYMVSELEDMILELGGMVLVPAEADPWTGPAQMSTARRLAGVLDLAAVADGSHMVHKTVKVEDVAGQAAEEGMRTVPQLMGRGSSQMVPCRARMTPVGVRLRRKGKNETLRTSSRSLRMAR